MAPKRKGSFLTRGRQRVQQTQQMKQSAARQLPPKGGTGANKPKATAQRTATAVTQRVRQDVATLRALGENMKRNQARAERQIPADKSPSVRRVGPGGANPKPQGQLPPGQRGGDLRQRGGALATRDGGAVRQRGGAVTPPRPNNGPVRPVSVRDLGNTKSPQVGGSGGRNLPPSQRGDSPASRPPAATRPAAGQRGGPLVTRAGARVNMGGARGAVVGALGSAIADPLGKALGSKLGEMLKPLGRAIDDRLPGVNSKDEARRTASKQPLRQMTAQERSKAVRLQQAEPKDMSGRPKPPSAPTLPASVRSAASPTGGSTPSRSSSPTGRTSSTPKPGSTTGSSKPQGDATPKPPNLPKVETETSDAPKPPAIESSASKKSYKRVLGASRQDMIEDNIRRARKKSS